MTLPSMPANLVNREYLRIAGGYGSAAEGTSPAGGLDADNAGNLAMDGDFTVGGNAQVDGDLAVDGDAQIDGGLAVDGDLSLAGQVSGDLTFSGDLRQGVSGCDKTWSVMLRPGAGIEPYNAGPVTVYPTNAHQQLIAIPFDASTDESTAVVFAVPPDYDGSALKVRFFWTCANSGLSGDAYLKLYGAKDAAGDGDSLNQTLGTGTKLQCTCVDTYQGQWLLHVIDGSFSLGGDGGGVFVGKILRSTAASPFADDLLLLGIQLSYV